MSWSDTLQNLMLVGGGAVAIEFLRYLKDVSTKLLGWRKDELRKIGEELALVTAERDKQTLLKKRAVEAVYVLRLMMIKSGHWTEKTLPEEPEE